MEVTSSSLVPLIGPWETGARFSLSETSTRWLQDSLASRWTLVTPDFLAIGASPTAGGSPERKLQRSERKCVVNGNCVLDTEGLNEMIRSTAVLGVLCSFSLGSQPLLAMHLSRGMLRVRAPRSDLG